MNGPSPHDSPAPAGTNSAMSEAPAASGAMPAKSSRSGLLATAGLVLAGIVLLGGAVIPWWLSDPGRVSAWIARNAPHLHGRVEMAKATFTWLGPIVFEDVVVVPEGGRREPVVIRRVEAEHGIAAFLLSGGDVGRVQVEGFEGHVVFDAERNSNVTGLFVDPGAPDPAGSPGAPQKTPLRMVLAVDDARLRIEGPWSDAPWISDPIDLEMRLARSESGDASEWTIAPTKLLDGASLDPSVAQGVLAYIAPVLADATRTGGRFSLAIDGGTFPVGAPEKSRLSGTLTMHAVDLGPGPLVTGILEAVPGRIQIPTSIRIADDSRIAFRMEDRRVWHDGLEFGLPLARESRLDLSSSGSVGLDDKVLDLRLALPIPADVPTDRPVLASLAGKTVSIGIGGRLGSPKVEFDGSIRGAAADVIVGVIERFRNRAAPPRPEAPRSPAPVPRPGWKPEASGEAFPPAAEVGQDQGVASDGGAAAESLPPPPPRPGWSPITRPGVAAGRGDRAGASEAKAGDDAPGTIAGDATARPIDAAAGDASTDGRQSEKQGTAQVLDQIRDRLAPEMADNPQADRVIDLVGGLIDEVARRRAERAAAQNATPAAGQDPAARGAGGQPPAGQGSAGEAPRRGRLLRRLLQPDPSGPTPATQPSPQR